MVELLIAGGFLAGMLALSAGVAASGEAWLLAGFWLGVVGLGFGLPTGLYYHVALARSLRRVDELPEGWYWRPTSLHGLLPEADRPFVLAWCAAGALGFLVAVAGCVVVAVGIVRTF